MDLATITAIRDELELKLKGQRFGKIFQLSKTDVAVDFRMPDSTYLFLSVESKNPRAYLIRRKLRDLEKISGTPGNFALTLRKKLSGAELSSVEQVEDERVLLFDFAGEDDLGKPVSHRLAAQLTGASANLFLLGFESKIMDSLRQTRGDGQQIGDTYSPPARREGDKPRSQPPVNTPLALSARLDAEDQERSFSEHLKSIAGTARAKLKQEISKREKLLRKLNEDLVGHGDADKWKRFGDLLLANASSARRVGEAVFLIDYFDDDAPEITVAVDENDSLTQAAEKYFRRYTKARNALLEIEKRRQTIAKELERYNALATQLETAIASEDQDLINKIAGIRQEPTPTRAAKKPAEVSAGARSFVSSDGFEILVGKKAKDNDFLTFRVAKSLDTWMHAADYPGSHVVVRNPNRKEIPHRTLLEAAQLAAFYSRGKSQPKAAVHYTQKKFVNKPKGAMPGLVSLASFKTILVEPKIGEAKLKDEG
ncbi:MAG TPA: NFACT family protein [Pyrinomonadaceae bacterium]|nr:NFACT family protein [Pyrinomonadaceae bacterium]